MVHHDSCPLCLSREITAFLVCTDHFLSGEEYEIWQCGKCGFRFTQDYPGEDSIGKYYESEDYVSHSEKPQDLVGRLYNIVRKTMLRRKGKLTERISGIRKGNLLDIGSGTGHYAATMKDRGWSVKCIEINDRARGFSERNFGLDAAHPSSIKNLPDGSFDCITLWHVMEHFHNLDEYRSEIFRLLKPGGKCIIAVPNCDSPDARHYGRFWAAWDVPRHLWHFSSKPFRVFSDKGGFILEKSQKLPIDVFFISYLSRKYMGASLPFISGILRAIPWFIQTLSDSKKASSLIFILRKP